MTPLRRRMTEDMILRNLAPGTIRQYVNCVAGCARHFNTSPDRLGPEQVRSYLLHLVQERHVSWSYYCQVRSALQFLYRVTLGMDWVVEEVRLPQGAQATPHHPQGLRITIANLGHMGSFVSRANSDFCRTVLRLSDNVVTNTAHCYSHNII